MNFFNQSMMFKKLRQRFIKFCLEPIKPKGRGRSYKQIYYNNYLPLVEDYNKQIQITAKICEIMSSLCLTIADLENNMDLRGVEK